ncbi:reverse transcriptase domain-containing protein [Tanacetum coccineum]
MEETLPTEKEKARAVRRKSVRVLQYAFWDKICSSKDHTDGILLANNACGCKKNDKGMLRLPGSPPCAKKPATKNDSHHVPVVVLQVGKQFRNNPFKDWCEKLCIRQHFTSVKHPQANGLVKRASKSLREGIKALMDEKSKDWIEEISHVLWAHRTMIKSSNEDTPFSLTFETKAVIPAEIGTPTLRIAEIDIVQNDEALEINLDLLEERREQAAIHKARSKAKMEKYYNTKVRNTSFKPRDLVYMNNDVSHAKDSRKLSPKWEGSYEVTEALGNGPYKLRDRSGCSFRELGTSTTSKNVTCMKCKHPSLASLPAEGAVFKFLFSRVMSFI